MSSAQSGRAAPAMAGTSGGTRAQSSGAAGSSVAATAGSGDAAVITSTAGAGAIAAGGGGAPAPAGASASAGAGGMNAAGAAAPVVCPTTVMPAGETTAMLQVGGMARTFILHVPSSYTGKTAVPLVLDWHGLGSSGSAQEGLSGYKALSDQEGFIVAWPNGLENAWNIGPCCTTSRDVDDLGFARAIVADIEQRACIDPKRVYSDGYSMGGGMSHYLACNAADIFAAVAPSAFDLLEEDEEPCKPARPISVISFRGTSDPIVPYGGGASMPPNGVNVTIHFLGAEATLKKWSELDGCMGMPMDTGNGCQTYSQCQQGTEVTLCTKQGGSHDPGDANQGWAFLKKHPMP